MPSIHDAEPAPHEPPPGRVTTEPGPRARRSQGCAPLVRLGRFGPGQLGDAELLSLLVRGPRPEHRASLLLEELGGLEALAGVDALELCRRGGLGRASACALVAAVELSRRLARAERRWELPLRRPTDVAAYVRAQLRGAPQEQFMVLGLDARQRVLLQRVVAVGSLSQVDVHPRELFRPLVRAGVHSAILVHNHPSGDPQPSDADVELTHRMAEVGRLLGIVVLDHLVVTDADSVSLAAMGLVPR